MADAGPIRRIIIPFVCLAITAAGLNNVYGDASEVERLSEQTACGSEQCAVTKVEEGRTPFSHKYVYQTSLKAQTTATVECSRELVLIGAWHCEKK
jgi:hypothetical protein